MRLAAAASRFDQQVLVDAYGTDTVKGQLDVFDDTEREGVTTRRRILSTAPASAIPARRALRLGDRVWLVGGSNPDYFRSEPIRTKYVLHQTDGLAWVQTFGQFLRNAGPWTLDSGLPTLDSGTATLDNGGTGEGLSAWAAIEWVKATKEIDESSTLSDLMMAVFAAPETLPAVGMVTIGGASYLLREPHASAAGFRTAYADEVPLPVTEQATFASRAYSPVDDTWTETVGAVRFLRLRWQTHFEYLSVRTLTFQPGDEVFVCLTAAATPKANDHITLSDGTWQVLTVRPDGDCWSLHVRRIPV